MARSRTLDVSHNLGRLWPQAAGIIAHIDALLTRATALQMIDLDQRIAVSCAHRIPLGGLPHSRGGDLAATLTVSSWPEAPITSCERVDDHVTTVNRFCEVAVAAEPVLECGRTAAPSLINASRPLYHSVSVHRERRP